MPGTLLRSLYKYLAPVTDFTGNPIPERARVKAALKGDPYMASGKAALFGAILMISSPRLEAQALEVGKPFPSLVLPTLDGSPSSVAAFRGRKLVLHIWASW